MAKYRVLEHISKVHADEARCYADIAARISEIIESDDSLRQQAIEGLGSSNPMEAYCSAIFPRLANKWKCSIKGSEKKMYLPYLMALRHCGIIDAEEEKRLIRANSQ